MAKKTPETDAASSAESENAATVAPETNAVANPAPATELDEASGAIIEPEASGGVALEHESVDSNPRAGTTAAQNGIDFNDPARRNPNAKDFSGQGLDPTPYGKGAK